VWCTSSLWCYLGRGVQVKSSDGKQTLIIKLRYTDTIGTLRSFVRERRMDDKVFELRTAFPNRAYVDDEETLQHAGLTPNAVVMVRVIASE
jgi:UBX domain-containing protein 11